MTCARWQSRRRRAALAAVPVLAAVLTSFGPAAAASAAGCQSLTGAATSNGLLGVVVTSASNAWAVGSTGARTLILRWDGRAWQRVPSPSPGSTSNLLFGVGATSASNAWAVGDFASGDPSQALALHCC
jgi:hypothetical protein